jgi:2,5-diamino-6-(ribosylamino)-4(3H)-pyrimidinone 5'-phosphate reductase
MANEDRPHVVLQMSASIDGRIALGPAMTMFDAHPASEALPDEGDVWARVAAAIDEVWSPQATLMGSGTVQRETAPWTELPGYVGDAAPLHVDFLPDEVVAGTSHWHVLVDGRGRCRSGYKATENAGGHVLHLVSHAAPPDYLAFLRRERIPYLIGGRDHADLDGALRKLRELLGVHALRLWGGGILNGVMLRAGLIDEVHLILKPALIGGRRTPTLVDCDDLAVDERPAVLELLSARPQEGGFVWLHYRVRAAVAPRADPSPGGDPS